MFIGTIWWRLIILRNVKSFIISWFWVENFWPNVENFLVVLSKQHSWCPWEHFLIYWKTCVFHITFGRTTRKNSALCRKFYSGLPKLLSMFHRNISKKSAFPQKIMNLFNNFGKLANSLAFRQKNLRELWKLLSACP